MTSDTKTRVNVVSFFKKNIIEIPIEKNTDLEANDVIIFRNEDGAEDAGKILNFTASAANLPAPGLVSFGQEDETENFVILRKATSHDMQKVEAHGDRRGEAMDLCQQQIEVLNLDMNVFDASYSFDGKRLAFLFTADERVDFRELVKKLATIFKKQIHLHQVGPRDRARIKGGCGKCGKEICCKNWIRKLASITMDIVRVQGLEGKGGSKLSGICGKLLCCLKYEVEEYRRMRKDLPPIRSIIETKDGKAEVIGLNILNRKIKVIFEEGKFAVISDKEIKRIIKSPESEEEAAPAEDSAEII